MSSQDAPAPDRVPDDVRALLRERIESYEELEVLLALERDRSAERTAEELSAAQRIAPALAEAAVRALESRGLLAGRRGSAHGSCYRYSPATPALDAAVRGLVRVYAEQPISIIKIMSENAIQRVRTGAVRAFADAFILRKDKSDG
jgi:DNA-binding MarR family transcriptional regulator